MDAYATNLAKKLKALLESTTTLQAYVLFKICGNCTGLLNIKKLFARMEPLSKYLMCTCKFPKKAKHGLYATDGESYGERKRAKLVIKIQRKFSICLFETKI